MRRDGGGPGGGVPGDGGGPCGPGMAEVVPAKQKPIVQIAILLDTSNSMDGLIGQAKTQLWKIVNEFAKAQRDGRAAGNSGGIVSVWDAVAGGEDGLHQATAWR